MIVCPENNTRVNLRFLMQELAKQTFSLLKCCDYARVDFRLDTDMNPYVLEINSMASIHEKGSYFYGAKEAGFEVIAKCCDITKTQQLEDILKGIADDHIPRTRTCLSTG